MKRWWWAALLAGSAVLFLFSARVFSPVDPAEVRVRIGHLPNLTHAQALLAQAERVLERKWKGQVRVEWRIFNAEFL